MKQPVVHNARALPNGRMRVTVELAPGEKLLKVREGAHYQLAQPVGDVVGAHIIADAEEVTWCSAAQAWVS